MPYQGVAFAFMIGVGLAAAALVFLLKSQERFEQPHIFSTNNDYYDNYYPAGGSRSSSSPDERRRKRQNSSADSQCAICQEELLLPRHQDKRLRCGHKFHLKCIDTWAKVKRECPCCREAF